MDHLLAQEIIACLPSERNLYYYYRDRYSLGLLRHISRYGDKGLSLAALKNSHYAPLLQKPRIKNILAKIGKHQPTEDYWSGYDYDEQQEMFVLTLDTWGEDRRKHWRGQQTSRPGCNLVLQMNFSGKHDAEYAKLHARYAPFSNSGHPISDKRHTLAWPELIWTWTVIVL